MHESPPEVGFFVGVLQGYTYGYPMVTLWHTYGCPRYGMVGMKATFKEIGYWPFVITLSILRYFFPDYLCSPTKDPM